MLLKTAHFGVVEYDESKKFIFPDGLPGLPEDTEFALLSHEQSEPIVWLQSMISPEIALPVLNPFLVCPTYSFDITDSDVELLKIDDIQDVFIINVVVIPQDPNAMTINLAAPIIVNTKNNHGRQIFLNDKAYHVRTRISDLLDEMNSGE